MLSTWKLDHSSAHSRLLLRLALSLLAIALLGLTAAAQDYDVTILTSDIPDVGNVNDTNLVNPWGLAASPTSPWWVSDNGTGLSTLYDAAGNPQQLVVMVPQWDNTPGGNPTGVVFNGTGDFQINGSATHFLFATEDGTIQGWTGGASTIIAVNNFPGSVYKGLTLGSAGGVNYIYAANFRNGTVDVFDTNFSPHSFGNGAFQDNHIPGGFAPFDVANIGGNIVVTFAKQDAEKHDDVAGPGNGFVDVFDSQGNLIRRLQHNAFLNSPWAVVKAPSDFGVFSNKLLIGQFGSGAILAYDDHGHFAGLLTDAAVLPARINALWGLGFGNDHTAGPHNVLYFAAGTFAEAHGTFGTISVAQCQAPFCRNSQPQTHRLSRHKE